jgi:hypothetical protein
MGSHQLSWKKYIYDKGQFKKWNVCAYMHFMFWNALQVFMLYNVAFFIYTRKFQNDLYRIGKKSLLL